jgi:hypothetical protein
MGGQLRIGELGQRHEEGAAATALRLDLLVEGVEERQDALARRPDDRRGRLGHPRSIEAVGALDVGGDQVVLGREQPVQRRGGHAGLGGDRVDPGRADPVPVEELVGDRQDVLAGLGGGSPHAGLAWGLHGPSAMIGIVP